MQIFGAADVEEMIGFPRGTESGVNTEDLVMPYLDCLATFRKQVKANAVTKKDMDALNLCDSLRDDVLPFLGIRLEDADGE